MEGIFAFFLESSFLGLFLFAEKRMSKLQHWFTGLLLWLGSWLSGFFIVATDAWMQHPVGYERAAYGSFQLTSLWQLVLNPWAWWQVAHTLNGGLITGSFVMSAVGAYYLLGHKHLEHGRIFVRLGVIAALAASFLQLYPLGDTEGRLVARHQPVTLAAMEGLFETQPGAPLVILGQPNVAERTIDNPIVVPNALSFLTWRSWHAAAARPKSRSAGRMARNVPLLYYVYHIMVGLGTVFIAISVIACFLLWRKQLYNSRWMLWILLLAAPFGLLRTADGCSKLLAAGNGWFSFLGFCGMYTVLAMLFLFLVLREIERGPATIGTVKDLPVAPVNAA
jgi:cytochrome d ubiquinol oxidase subunit I